MSLNKKSTLIRTCLPGTVATIALASSSIAAAIDSAESAFELLDSDLTTVSLLTVHASSSAKDWELQTTVSQASYDIDFQPVSFDLFGIATQRDENTVSTNLTASKQIQDSLRVAFGAGYRDGFPNFRSVWLDTYFDQHFAPLEGVPGHELYNDFKASAASFSSELKWEYLPANGVASVSLSRIQDNVSPGYEIDFDGIRRGELVLSTTSLSLVSENVLTPSMRSRVALSASETSARETRYSAEIAINTALGTHFIWRNKIGASTENPTFDARFFDTAIEYQASDSFAVYLQGRHYSDTGEIEDALLFSTAAPELTNDSIGLGLRYTGDSWSSKLGLMHSRSDFAETNPALDFFKNLYVDADWLTVQIAVAKTF